MTELGLPVRTQNALIGANILTVHDLAQYSKKELLSIKGCSLKSVDILTDIVERQLGLSFRL